MFEAFPSAVGIALFLAMLFGLLANRPYLLVALLWLLIPMAWRLASSLHIDLAGPIFADQILQHVGPGYATALLAVDYAVVLGVFGAVLPRSFPEPSAGGELAARFERLWPSISNLAFGAGVSFLAATYFDMVRIGSIPLLSGIERYDYAREHASVLHHLLFRFGDVAALALGCLFVFPSCFGRAPALRFLGLLLAMLAYAFLTGHRYSAFFKFCTMFALPCAILFAFRTTGNRRGEQAMRYAWPALIVLAAAVAAMVSYTIAKSYFTIRYDDSDDALTSLKLRLLIQQAELWWLTHYRVVEIGVWDFGRTVDFLFQNPIDAGRNTSVQYLMYLAIGSQAIPVLDANVQFAGGFPEIPHELFGTVGGVLAVAVLSLIPAVVLRILLGSIVHGRLLTALWAGLVLYPLAIMYWGGMLNFVLAWTFWVKVAGLAISLLAVRKPWWSRVLFPKPAA